ncbi:hypothetical protein BJY04DRAFT_225168 [Aspergillus karnatakaensis]|uniref:uncharacterized protein n=1 Tax=Aspergillus karnatakaensis TaxID=1810916 RepID=UPI003CCD232D
MNFADGRVFTFTPTSATGQFSVEGSEYRVEISRNHGPMFESKNARLTYSSTADLQGQESIKGSSFIGHDTISIDLNEISHRVMIRGPLESEADNIPIWGYATWTKMPGY